MWKSYVGTCVLLLVLSGCGDGESLGPADARDCRRDGIGCTAGFTCQINPNGLYQCLPGGSDAELDQSVPDQSMSDQSVSDQAVRDQGVADQFIPDQAVHDALPAPRCDDRQTNGDETDVDCGGACARCAEDRACVGGDDCQSGVCTNGHAPKNSIPSTIRTFYISNMRLQCDTSIRSYLSI